MQQHCFEISKEGLTGLLLVKGPVAIVAELVSHIANEKKGISVDELDPAAADKLKAQLEG